MRLPLALATALSLLAWAGAADARGLWSLDPDGSRPVLAYGDRPATDDMVSDFLRLAIPCP